MTNVVQLPVPPTGWNTVNEAERSARAVGMSPVPLLFKSKAPKCKSHPALSIKQFTEYEFASIVGTNYKHGLGIVGGRCGWFVVDIDAGGDEARALVEKHLGKPLTVIVGNPAHAGKLLYIGPWLEPDAALVRAADSYFMNGLVHTRFERELRKLESLPRDSATVVETEARRALWAAEHDKAGGAFSRLCKAWIEEHKLIPGGQLARRQDSVGNVVLSLEVKSFGDIIAMPPTLHPKIEGVRFTWDGVAPLPFLLECAPRVQRDQVQGLLQEAGGTGLKSYVSGAALPEAINEGSRDKTLISAAGSMRRKGLDVEEILPALLAMNLRRCSPPLDDKQVEKIARSIGRYPAGEVPAEDESDTADNGKGRKSQADVLIEIAGECQLFYSPDGGRYADVPVNGHVETMDIDGPDFRDWLQDRYYRLTKRGVGSEAVKTAIQTIRARARSADDAVERRVHLRVAEHDCKLYIDMCDKTWRAIEVDYNDWRIVERPPVRFIRKPGMAALPEPTRVGSINDLRPFMRADGDDFVLIVGWILGGLRGGASEYPILAYSGAPDSGKSTRAQFARLLVDPNVIIDQGAPKSKDELLVSAEAQHVVVLDNLSSIPPELSDTICRLCNGGGDRKRKLYTDDGVHIFKGVRPMMITSIGDVITRSDTSSRCLFVYFQAIPENERLAKDLELVPAFAKAAPGIFGALLDAMVCGLKTMMLWRLCGTGPKGAVLRLVSFERWVMACEGALPWPTGTFRRAFENNKRRRLDMLIETESVIGALAKLLDGGDFADVMDGNRVKVWEGNATQLLEALNTEVEGRIRQAEGWPRKPHVLSKVLTEQTEALQQVGISIRPYRKQDPVTKAYVGSKILRITKVDLEAATQRSALPP